MQWWKVTAKTPEVSCLELHFQVRFKIGFLFYQTRDLTQFFYFFSKINIIRETGSPAKHVFQKIANQLERVNQDPSYNSNISILFRPLAPSFIGIKTEEKSGNLIMHFGSIIFLLLLDKRTLNRFIDCDFLEDMSIKIRDEGNPEVMSNAVFVVRWISDYPVKLNSN